MIKLDFNYVKNNQLVDFEKYQDRITEIDKMIKERTGLGNDFLGWYGYANTYDKLEVKRMIKKAKEFREKYDTLVVCGIGGSYLGSNAVIDAINGLYPADSMKIVYLGNTLDPNYIHLTLEYL